jgi:uncharacterized protein (TIGR00255 family)
MIRSMTAFGRARRTVGGKDITVEIKSVNNRFFDCSVKLPRSFSFLEERIKPHLQSAGITRGKVDVFIGIDVIDTPDINIDVDEGYVKAYVDALRKLSSISPSLKDDISVMSVAQNRDVFIIKKPEDDIEHDWADISSVLNEACERFISERIREGQNIESDLKTKIDAIRVRVDEIEGLSDADTVSYREKLEGRLDILHLKDIKSITIDGWNTRQEMCEVGRGLIAWDRVIDAAEKTGVKHYVVEQDGGWIDNDPFKSLEVSKKYLEKYLIH